MDPPSALVAAELVFFVQLARIATRTRIAPLQVRARQVPESADAYAGYFGVAVRKGKRPAVSFKAEHARLPFLIANEKMWQVFEPDLRKRLAELDESASVTERTRSALLELLPGGNATMDVVSNRLGTSTRTLQRKLRQEGRNFQALLNATRARLARHYLENSNISASEISFLLGFEDANSFFRAFHSWMGSTPERVRNTMMRTH